MIAIEQINGIGDWESTKHGEHGEDIVYSIPNGKAFLVVRPKTIEVRCERNLSRTLRDDYESVMESRYFGRGGIEIVPSGQLSDAELEDLVRLSYNLTMEEKDA